MEMKKILFVEDDKDYRKVLANVLEEEGYQVEAVEDALIAIQKCTLQEYDLIISDLMMETIDGIQLLTHIKKENPKVKTMILTAEPSMDTELESLNIYVDKYLAKETRIDVLLKHIETVMGKDEAAKKSILVVKDENIIVDALAYKVTKHDEEIHFTMKEFRILKLLLENQGIAVSREMILKEIWDNDEYEGIDTRVIDVHIKTIRRKLGVQKIVSIRGIGYKWDN